MNTEGYGRPETESPREQCYQMLLLGTWNFLEISFGERPSCFAHFSKSRAVPSGLRQPRAMLI